MPDATKNPALLKLEVALAGVSSALPLPEVFELQLDGEMWVRARRVVDSPLELLADGAGHSLRSEGCDYPVRLLGTAQYAERTNGRGVALGDIVALYGNYAVIELGGGCGLTLPGRVCAFCRGRELLEQRGELWLVAEVVEALRAVFDEGAAEFVLFQLGYLPGHDAGLSVLFPYVEAVRRHFDTMVALTMHPPADPRAIEVAYAAGVDALSLNLEAADEASLETHFPGRARFIGRARYLESLAHAARIFPNGGVFSELNLGLSPRPAISAALSELTALGVLPILSLGPTPAPTLTSAELAPLCAQLFEDCLTRRLNLTWARDLSTAITPLEARYFVGNAPQLPVLLQGLARNRLGALATRSLAKLRRRLRVKRVRASLDASRL